MVTEYGMSAKVGSVKLGLTAGEPFLGRDMGASRDYSDTIAETIDEEVRKLIDEAHDEAWQVLNTNRDTLDKLASELLEKETLDHNQLAEIFVGIEKLPERPLWLSSDSRPLSDRPPVKVPARAPVDSGLVDGGVESDTPASSARPQRPLQTPGIATA
jgi:cell division protease FtsH